jgi:uncharacterized protein YeaO (DUF488 family)
MTAARGSVTMIKTKRVYEPPEASDGYRVLVDRLWPRGLTKDKARLDEWLKEIAPSTELRKWFHRQPGRWPEFVDRYKRELASPENVVRLGRLKNLARTQTVTLLYGSREEQHNHAVVIAQMLRGV